MSAAAISGFMQSDYGVVAGVKMLNFFRFLGEAGLIALGVLVLVSVFVQNVWCRYSHAPRICFVLSPLRVSARARAVHRMREMRQSLPVQSAGGPPHHH